MYISTLHLGTAQQFQKKCFVTGTALDDDNTIAQHSLQPGKRFVAILTVGDDFGDHGVEFRRNGITLRHTRVNPDSWPRQNPEPLDGTRGRSKTVVWIFRIQPHLDGVTVGARRLSFQTATAGDVNLKFDQINPGGAFRHRMFDLQPGIHLHKQEAAGFWFIEKFHRAGVVISGCLAQAHCRLAQRLILLQRECRGRRFFEDFLMAALNRTVAHADGPGGSIVVGNDLHFDVARLLHHLLHENSGIAEGFEGFGAGALKGLRKFSLPNVLSESRDRLLRPSL